MSADAPESVIAVSTALHAGLNRSGFDRMLARLHAADRHDDIALIDRYRSVISMVRSGVTWCACTGCGRGKFIKSSQKAAVCDITIPCDGVMIPASAKVLNTVDRS